MKYLIPILLLFATPVLALFFVGSAAATPTPSISPTTTPTPSVTPAPPTPSPSPTPARREISDYRVPIGSAVGYGEQDGGLLRIRVDEDGHLIVNEE